MTKRKKYTKEFKLDAISLVRDQNLNVAEACATGMTLVGQCHTACLVCIVAWK